LHAKKIIVIQKEKQAVISKGEFFNLIPKKDKKKSKYVNYTKEISEYHNAN